MPRAGRLARPPLMGLTVVCLLAGCQNSSGQGAGNALTLVNDTKSTVTVKSCSQACISVATTTLTPTKVASFRPSSGALDAMEYLVINGYGSTPRCYSLGPNALPEEVKLTVTGATADQCTGQPQSFPPTVTPLESGSR